MAETTTVEITYGSVTVQVKLAYRWYAPGNDPWERVKGSPKSMPKAGEWENRKIVGNVSNVRMYTDTEGHVMTLKQFKRIKVGSKGEGEFYASGYLIPQFSIVDWRVITVVL